MENKPEFFLKNKKKLKVQLIFVDLDTKEVSTDMPHASNKRLDLN
jgi:hypothetical protein